MPATLRDLAYLPVALAAERAVTSQLTAAVEGLIRSTGMSCRRHSPDCDLADCDPAPCRGCALRLARIALDCARAER